MCSLTHTRRRAAVEALESRRLFATGLVVEDLPDLENVEDVQALAGGKVLVLGVTQPEGAGAYMARKAFLVRHLPDGSIDDTFGTGGIAYVEGLFPAPNYRHGNQMAVTPDGSILVWGTPAPGHTNTGTVNGVWMHTGPDVAIVRLRPDGTADTTFGTNGQVLFDWPDPSGFSAQDMALLPDGRIVLAGTVGTFPPRSPARDVIVAESTTGLVRLNADGSLDTTFDGDGRVQTKLSVLGSTGLDVAVQPDGKLVVVVDVFPEHQYLRLDPLHVARYNTDGSLDTTFGQGGLASVAVPDRDVYGSKVIIDSDGRIVALGSGHDLTPEQYVPGRPSDLVLVRLLPDGTPDPAFGGGDGLVVDPQGNGYLLAPGPNGSVYVGGMAATAGITLNAPLLVRFDPAGNRDAAFGTDGRVARELPGITGGQTFGAVIDVQDDGKVLVGATATANAVVTRYNPDGSPDLTFGDDTLVLPVEPVRPPPPPFPPVTPTVPTTPPVVVRPEILTPRGRVLQVRGTAGDDTINISVALGGGRLRVEVNGTATIYLNARLRRLVVRGLEGNDRVVIASDVPIPALVHGGAGDDHLEVRTLGNDAVFGGPGNDTIAVAGGRDIMFGGPGHDIVRDAGSTSIVRQMEETRPIGM